MFAMKTQYLETVKNRANMGIPEYLELYSLVCVVRDEGQTQ
jgi:hypothetical protein